MSSDNSDIIGDGNGDNVGDSTSGKNAEKQVNKTADASVEGAADERTDATAEASSQESAKGTEEGSSAGVVGEKDEKPKGPLNEIVQPFIDLVRAPRALWGVNLAYFLEGMVYFGMLMYLAMYFNDYVGLDDAKAAIMVGVLTSGITLSMVLFGGLGDKWGVRRALLTAFVLMITGRVLLSVGPTLGLEAGGLWSTIHLIAMGGILFVVLGYGMYQPAAYAAVRQFTTPATAGMAFAMLYALMNLGGFVPAFFSPMRKAVGISGTYWVLTGASVCALVFTALILTKKVVATAIAQAKAARKTDKSDEQNADEAQQQTDEGAEEKQNELGLGARVWNWLRTHPLADAKFAFFIFALIPVQTLFAHNWLTLPMYVDRAYRPAAVEQSFEPLASNAEAKGKLTTIAKVDSVNVLDKLESFVKDYPGSREGCEAVLQSHMISWLTSEQIDSKADNPPTVEQSCEELASNAKARRKLTAITQEDSLKLLDKLESVVKDYPESREGGMVMARLRTIWQLAIKQSDSKSKSVDSKISQKAKQVVLAQDFKAARKKAADEGNFSETLRLWIGENFEAAVNFNPLLIFVLVPIVTALTQRRKVYNMMIVGTLVMAAPTFLLALGANFWTLLGYILIMTVGEAMWQPRFLQYAAEIAPEGRTAAYMGVAQLPWFLTKVIVPLYSGYFLGKYVPDGGMVQSERMWLIYAFIAVLSTVLLVAAKGWVGKDFKTKAS